MEFPNVSQGPLLPHNLCRKLEIRTEEICNLQTTMHSARQRLTNQRPSLKQNFHLLQVPGCHSNTRENIYWHLFQNGNSLAHVCMDYFRSGFLWFSTTKIQWLPFVALHNMYHNGQFSDIKRLNNRKVWMCTEKEDLSYKMLNKNMTSHA